MPAKVSRKKREMLPASDRKKLQECGHRQTCKHGFQKFFLGEGSKERLELEHQEGTWGETNIGSGKTSICSPFIVFFHRLVWIAVSPSSSEIKFLHETTGLSLVLKGDRYRL